MIVKVRKVCLASFLSEIWPIEHISVSPGFVIVDLRNGLHKLFQKKMPIASFVSVIFACQTWVRRHWTTVLNGRSVQRS